MGLFGRKNKRNNFDIKVLYAGKTSTANDLNLNPLDDKYISLMTKALCDPMTEGIPLDVLHSAFLALHSSILRSGMELNDKKMVDRCFAGLYQTILYPVIGGKIEFMYDSRSKHGTVDFWFDMTCNLDMTRDDFIRTILLPALDELKGNGIHFNIKN